MSSIVLAVEGDEGELKEADAAEERMVDPFPGFIIVSDALDAQLSAQPGDASSGAGAVAQLGRAAGRGDGAGDSPTPADASPRRKKLRWHTKFGEIEETTLEERQSWFEQRTRAGYPVLVAADTAGPVLGFSTFGDFRAWPGYRHTVEHPVYVRSDARRRGVSWPLGSQQAAAGATAGALDAAMALMMAASFV